MKLRITAALLATIALTGCPDDDNPPPDPSPTTVDKGIYGTQLGAPMAKASAEQLEDFEAGRLVAERRFDTSTGLGPNYNVTFCGSCHEKPVFGGSAPRYRDFFLVGSKLPDGSFVGLGVNGVQTRFQVGLDRVLFNPIEPEVNLQARRNAIPFFGVGALAAIDEEAILANVDANDEDGDGISGRANYDREFVGRFGRKSQTVSLEGFIRGPLFNHAGITSVPLSQEQKAALPVPSQSPEMGIRNCVGCQAAAPEEPTTDNDSVPDPELSDEDLFDLVSFAMLMGAPAPDAPTEQTQRGEALFEEVNCTGCHVPGLQGKDGIVMAYSDLLLHDMGEELADGITQGLASGSEFRTQPLWGVVATGPWLHDGRADSLDEAIRWHGGEAKNSREAYEALSDSEREDVIAFLESLGGADQVSEGLVPPGTPIEAVGTFGGPREGVDEAQYLAGRGMFDRDFKLDEGLGDKFNGDSCRACHFEPSIGGAGPAGLNVVRMRTGGSTRDGSLLHRFSAVDLNARPSQSADTNDYEVRQTPALYGLGLIDEIPEMAIVMREDPEDLDGDGITGRAHRLTDGSVGRFGWKAQLPTLEDFARDALSAELGLTLSEGMFLAGSTTDSDDLADPEFEGAGYDDLVYYLKQLAPPPRGGSGSGSGGPFEAAGCDGCHVPMMQTAGGDEVWLYSDLLLHDVAPSDFSGVTDGDATEREFRTPPLWGIGATAPYMHDGLSPSLDHAIRRHAGEATASVEAYEAMSQADRDALLNFLRSL